MTQQPQSHPTNTSIGTGTHGAFRGNYLVRYTDATGLHVIPFAQSWYARSEALSHLKQGDQVVILSWDKNKGDYSVSDTEMTKTRAKLPQNNGPRTDGNVYEKMAHVLSFADIMTKQARKGGINTDIYNQFRELIVELDVLLNWVPAGQEEDI